MTKTMVDTGVITRAVELACHAPSLHNSQPWRWIVGRESVELFADPARFVATSDSSGREAIISCGVVLDHFRVAMAAVGWDCHVDQLPNPNDHDHLASISFASLDFVADARRDRAKAILERRTDRRAFRTPDDWASLETMLFSSYDHELASVQVIPATSRQRLAVASRLAEMMRRYDDQYHRELHWWTEPSRDSDGIPQSALVSESQARKVDIKRRFPARWYGERSSASLPDRAKILLLSTPGDTRSDALNCGQVLSAILLECVMAGLVTCPVTHVAEVETSRDVLRQLSGNPESVPQVVVRVGLAPPGDVLEPTPRRPIGEVVEIQR